MKTNFYKGLAGALLCLSAVFASCNTEQPEVLNKLSVTPDTDIAFLAADNGNVVLSVATDAAEWNVSGPSWIRTDIDLAAGKCTVNVNNNASAQPRVGRLEFTAGTAAKVYVAVTQDAPAENEDVLEVEPKEAIYFNASGNLDAEISVETNVAAGWNADAPEWVVLTKGEGKLTVNVADNNTDGTRSCRIAITAGEATPVYVMVVQRNTIEESDSVIGQIKGEDGATDLTFTVSDSSDKKTETLEQTITVTLAQPATEDAKLNIVFDEAYLDEFNFNHGMACELMDEKYVSIADDGTVTIAAGETTAEVKVTITVKELVYNVHYLVPLVAEPASDNLTISYSGSRVNYVVTRKFEKEVKNFLFFEVNDTNPLNALEYVLEDGQYFFDAVVLFAANINYNGEEDRVYLNNNPNVQALLDGTDTYIQPLREKGIKVYLGLLGNHDRAGLCGLSDWGAAEWAKEVAEACRYYKLDGVNMDEEYSSYQYSDYGKWFAYPNATQGARLAYELKKAMNEACDWPCDVTYFQYSTLYSASAVDGHQPGEFIDVCVGDYYMTARPFAGQTEKNCSYASFECNSGRNIAAATESTARTARNGGYGWLMWFAWDPCPLSGIYHDRDSEIKSVARGLYDQELVTPKYYYRKIGSGQYDPTPYERR